ncbi:bifunctional methylenetetrahydrofolate dehydrogenase/methenyltetrahydrofolate cyclohydrolase FolD [Geminicoccaceae bacterium 1502E]|nr:bifunctional methylenetetrahydrofolate dehydrogenase/methenyltetrahydrofolate cyclohydrolase FolD [Geminicoccaceae bacterium 1502E]
MSRIIDGRAHAAALREQLGEEVAELVRTTGVRPGLKVVLLGEHPASIAYVRTKTRMAEEVGMAGDLVALPETTSQADLLALIARLNADPEVHGILVQLPLPPQIDPAAVLEAIDPAKDVDGFHPLNAGRLAALSGGLPEDLLVPCTPQGCLVMLESELGQGGLRGMRALVLGRSNIVGKPMAALLLARDCTVTIAHSRTRDLAAECRRADILVAAVGRPEMVRGDWVKEGAVVIDVGINRVEKPGGGSRLTGDVAFAEAAERAAAITPVPGGVGPMTVACLLRNTVIACRGLLARRAGGSA